MKYYSDSALRFIYLHCYKLWPSEHTLQILQAYRVSHKHGRHTVCQNCSIDLSNFAISSFDANLTSYQSCQICHPNWVRLAPNRINLGLLKSPRFVQFGANLTQLAPKSDKHEERPHKVLRNCQKIHQTDTQRPSSSR